jgi:long-chain acyl-CoA synthetase
MCAVPLIIEKIYKNSVVPTVEKSKTLSWLKKKAPWLLYWLIGKKLYKTFGGKLKFFGIGGSKLDPTVEEFLNKARFPYAIGYGLTETAPTIASESYFFRKAGSVGHAMPGVEVKINDPDEDGIGELFARGPNIMKGYLDDDEANSKVFVDGWFNTGDLARIDNEGYIFLTGRKKNVIVLKNGKNVYPEELEEHLAACPLFLESAVVGRESENEGAVITAVIYPDYEQLKGLDDAQIEEKVREALNEINRTLPQYKQMRGLEIRKTEFEKTTSRKIKRHKI